MKKTQKGFSFIEVIVTISLVMMITIAGVGLFKPWGDFRDRMETENKMKQFQQDMVATYKFVSGIAEASSTEIAAAADTGHLLIRSNPDGTGQEVIQGTGCGDGIPTTQTTEAALTPVAPMMIASINNAALDGFGRAFCVFVSKQLSMGVESVSEDGTGNPTRVYYHKVYLLSKGANETFDSSWNAVTGELLLNQDAAGNKIDGGDDQAVIIDGKEIQYGLYLDTVDKMRRVATAYRNYFRNQYMNSDQRDPIINYFHNAKTVDPANMAINNKASALPFQDVRGSVPAIDRGFLFADPLGHFAALRQTRTPPAGVPNPNDYLNLDGQAALVALGLTESETETATQGLLSGITHVMINNAREESGIKTPDATLPENRSAPYTVEVAAEIAPDNIGNANRNVIKFQIGGSWE